MKKIDILCVWRFILCFFISDFVFLLSIDKKMSGNNKKRRQRVGASPPFLADFKCAVVLLVSGFGCEVASVAGYHQLFIGGNNNDGDF